MGCFFMQKKSERELAFKNNNEKKLSKSERTTIYFQKLLQKNAIVIIISPVVGYLYRSFKRAMGKMGNEI